MMAVRPSYSPLPAQVRSEGTGRAESERGRELGRIEARPVTQREQGSVVGSEPVHGGAEVDGVDAGGRIYAARFR